MSLSIDVDKVRGVLLADGWHQVVGNSFDLDAYEYMHGDTLIHGGGEGGMKATGFRFKDANGPVYGPLSSILAVRLAN
jgi:hypothetical protein